MKADLTPQSSLVRFLVVGAGATLVNYATFMVLHLSAGIGYGPAYVAGFISGVIFGYFFNRIWSFEVGDRLHTDLFGRYLIVYLASLGIGFAMIYVMVEFVKIEPFLANLITIAITTCTNYIGIKNWAFTQ